MSRRLEAAQHLLAHARGLVRVFGAVVQSLVLAMLDVERKIFIRRRVTLELVVDQNPRGAAVLLHLLAHEPLGRVACCGGFALASRAPRRAGRPLATANASCR